MSYSLYPSEANPSSSDRAKDIAEFLVQEAPKIKDGYEVPDIRATATEDLIEALVDEDEFRIAKANVFRFG